MFGLIWAGIEGALPNESGWNDVIAAEARIEKVAGGFQFAEGPVWTPDGLVFSDVRGDAMYALKEGQVAVFRKPSAQANGNTLDRQGRLVTCHHAARSVTRTEKDGRVVTLAERFEGKRLNSPNDVVVGPKGDVYFSDPPYGIQPEQEELGFSGVFLIDGNGMLHLLTKDLVKPNGLAFSHDGRRLFIADTGRSHIRVFAVAADGSLSGGEAFVEVEHPDGMRLDGKGNLYCAGSGGVWVFAPSGRKLGVIPVPETPSNCAFGDDGHTLYITARTSLYTVRLKSKG